MREQSTPPDLEAGRERLQDDGSSPDGQLPEERLTGTARMSWVERLVSVQGAARTVAISATEWWQQLSQAADTVVTSARLDAFYRKALEAMQAALGADEVSILIADSEEQALVTRTSVGLGEDSTVSLFIPAGQGMAGRVMSTRQSLVVDDVRTITLVSPVLQDQGLRSIVAVPIMAGPLVVGVLHAGSRNVAHFTSADADLLDLLAERLAVAVDRVRLFEEQRHLASVASFLAETARIMAGATDLRATLEALAAAALPTLGDLCLIDMLEDGKLHRLVARHADPSRQALANRLRDEFAPLANGRHPAAEVLRIGGARWSPSMSDGFLRSTTCNEEHYRITKELGFRSYLVVPIRTDAHNLGALTMVSCSRALTSDDVRLAESLGQQVGSVVAKAQELEQVSLTSRLLQDALLPASLPDVPGLVIHARYGAASKALEVGGDFYDVIRLPDGRAWVSIGDVEGHDRQAAAVMGQLRSAARILALERTDPAEAIRALRSAWDHLDLPRMASLLLGLIDPVDGRTLLASAGHLPPIKIGARRASYVPLDPAPLLGIDGGAWDSSVMMLAPGETLLLYTDGAIKERQLGLDDGMASLLRTVNKAERSPQAICTEVLEAAVGNEDDVALLAIMRR